MVRNMNLKQNIDLFKTNKNKRGSYIVEGAMALPLFIVAVISLALIIRMIGVLELVTFNVSKTFKILAIEKNITKQAISPEMQIYYSTLKNNKRLRHFLIKDFDSEYSENAIKDMIMIKTRSRLNVSHVLGIDGKIAFDFNLLGRNFTGKKEGLNPLGEEAFRENQSSYEVVIFPKYGTRFHKKSCFYVNKKYKTEATKIEMEREDAIRKGYTPCEICRG